MSSELVSTDEPDFKPVQGRSIVVQMDENVWRPGQIVRVWLTEKPKTINAVVFVDGSNDTQHGGRTDNLAIWKTSITYGLGVGQYQGRVPELS